MAEIDTVLAPCEEKAPVIDHFHTVESVHSSNDKASSHEHGHEHKDNKHGPETEGLSDINNLNVSDPFPIDPNAPEETHQLTIRALVVGGILGAIVGASNIYLGLKTGVLFGPQLFGAIFSFSIIKPLSQAFSPTGIPGWIFGGYFGPKENCTAQSSATAAGGLGILFVSGVPAMYRLGLLSTPSADFGKLLALTFACGYFGVFFVIPLRKYFILRRKLVFPTPTATAFTIRSLHAGRAGAEAAKKKAWCLLITLAICFCYKILNGYVPGVFLDWHIGWTLYRIGWTEAIKLENWGCIIEFTPAFVGAGMLSGLNASWSFLGGSILAWGIIGPALVKNGLAIGKSIDPDNAPGYINYYSISFKDNDEIIHSPSPRYWLLWPGVMMMFVFSFLEIGMSSRHLFVDLFHARGDIGPAIKRIFVKDPQYTAKGDNDPVPHEDRVKDWWWQVGVLFSLIISCALLATQFDVGVGESILAFILAFLFSFICVQSSGDTDINPITVVAKASQIVFGGVSKGGGEGQAFAQRVNLVAGSVTGGAAGQAVDMTGDLKTAHLLGAKPKVQFAAQLFGATIALCLAPGLFVLFTTASPCIITGEEPCIYNAPSVAAWAAVAKAVTAPKLPVPPSSGYTTICLSIFVAIVVIVKHLWIPKKYWVWVPNWNAVGLGFIVPQMQYSIAMAFGSTFAYAWSKKNPSSFDLWAYALSAGFIAGEGLGGVFQALLAILKVDGSRYGITIGCPLDMFCG